jgi:hypothetical protein
MSLPNTRGHLPLEYSPGETEARIPHSFLRA